MHHDIIQGCKNNNPSQQRRLFELFAPKMMTVCRRYAQSYSESEDILQEAFIKIFKNFHQFHHESGNLEGWIRRIVVNEALQYWRKYHKNHAFTSEEFIPENTQPAMIDGYLNEEELLKLIESLPTGYRIIFNLFALEGFSHAEIAHQLNITESTSRSQLTRARKILQESIIQEKSLLYGKF